MKRFNHLSIAIIISIILAIITAVAITYSNGWGPRNIYNLIYFTFLSLSVLTVNALIFSKKRRLVPERLRKYLRINIIIIYSLAYIAAVSVYITTGQIIRTQTVAFFLGTGLIQTSIVLALAGLAILLLFVWFLVKKTDIEDSNTQQSKKIRVLFYINLILLLMTPFINAYFIKLENPLLSDNQALISYQAEERELENLANLSLTYRPNVIFILLESISPDRVGFHGYPRNVTPNIDALSERSIVFSNAYATATHSDYAQTGLLSSRYLLTDDTRTDFSQDFPKTFIWDVFKEQRYQTGYFSSQDDRWQNMNLYLSYENLDNYSYSITDGETDYGEGFGMKDYDHKTTEKALDWLNSTSDPFFLYLNFQATHYPNAYPPEASYFTPDNSPPSVIIAANEEGINRYDNSLRYVDEQIGKITKFLEENNLSDSTIITITSDHGHDLENRHGIAGHGNSIYEEELKVPALAFIPGVNATLIEERVSHIDFVPTLLDILNFPIPESFQGDIMKKNRPIYFVAQSHKYKIGIIQDGIKVIADMNRKYFEIYNISDDPNETKSLNPKDYKDIELQLLLWRHCQIDYYEKEKWESKLKQDRCSIHNNFKI